jgi:hypothetical protein
MDKSLEARRLFTAENRRMLNALKLLEAADENDLLKKIEIAMPVSVYEELIDRGLYSSIKRKKTDRRSANRRSGDRRQSGRR